MVYSYKTVVPLAKYNNPSCLGSPSSPVPTYESTHNAILVSWSPVGSDRVCGPVTYNITVMPSHDMMMMINDTVYNITGLNYNTNYIITVYATNNGGHGEPATVTVRTPQGTYVCKHLETYMLTFNYIYILCIYKQKL